MEGSEKGRQRCEGRWAWAGNGAGVDWEQVFGVKFFVGAGLFAILLDILENQAFLKDDTWYREKEVSKKGSNCKCATETKECDKPVFRDTTGSSGISPDTISIVSSYSMDFGRVGVGHTCAKHVG